MKEQANKQRIFVVLLLLLGTLVVIGVRLLQSPRNALHPETAGMAYHEMLGSARP